MDNRSVRYQFLTSIICLLFLTATLSAQKQASDSLRWSRIVPSGTRVVPSQVIQHGTPLPFTRSRVIKTVDGLATISPPVNIRMYPDANGTQSEMNIAVNPTNPQMVLAGSNAANNAVSVLSQGWYLTTDGGTTWSGSDTLPPHLPTLGTYYTSDPQVGIDRNGVLYFNTLHYNGGAGDVVVTKSSDNGRTWSDFVALPDSGNEEDKNWFAIDVNPSSPYKGNLYCAYTDFNYGGGAYLRIRFGRSTDGGATWQPNPTVNISDTNNYFDHGVSLTVGPNGEVYAAWSNYLTGQLDTSRVEFNKSTDGGVTWGTPSYATPPIGDIRGYLLKGSNSIRVNSFPSLAVDRSGGVRNGWLYAAFSAKNTSGQVNIYMVRSSNGGSSWSDTIKVNQDNSGRDHWFAACTVDPSTGHLYVEYYDSRNYPGNDTAQVYLSRSIDGGNTFQDFLVSDYPYLPQSIPGLASGYSGDYISITALNGIVWPCWNDNRTGSQQAYTAKMIFAYNYGFVQGIVSSASSGNPSVQDVSIDFTNATEEQTGISDANGVYFVGASVDTLAGVQQYTLRARKFGYTTFTDTVTLVLHDTVSRNITMTPAPGGTLVIRAHTKSGAPVKANVKIKFEGIEVLNDYTDSLTGIYTTPLPESLYDITVDPPSPYGTRSFTGVPILVNETDSLDVLLRSVVDPSPTALMDTLAAGQSNIMTLTLTNTTSDSIPFRISNDEASFSGLTNLPLFDPRSPSKDASLVVPKNQRDTRFGPPQTFGKGGPDTFGYVWIDSDEPGGPSYNWVEIGSVGTKVTSWSGTPDEGHTITDLPFNFPFYGGSYSQVKITTNGFISFDVASINHTYDNTTIPSAGEPNNCIFGFWTDLDLTTGGSVYYYNDVVNSRYIIEYANVPHYSLVPGVYTFEIILYPDGSITTQYNDMEQSLTVASIGVENSTGTSGLQVVFNNTYVHNNLAVLYKVRGVGWLSHNPKSGTLAPYDSVAITNTFDAANLIPGTSYRADIYVDATHPEITGSIIVPATLRVVPLNGPGIYVSPLTKNFGSVFINSSRSDTLKVRNIGTQQLTISSISSSNPHFTASISSSNLQPNDTTKLLITYSPALPAGAETGTIYILSNDPLHDTLNVSVAGTGVGLPHLYSLTSSLDKVLADGVKDSVQFNVGNNGTLDATYSARAIMYSLPARAGGTKTPIVLPMSIQKKSYNKQKQLFNTGNLSKNSYMKVAKGVRDSRRGPAQTFSSGGPDSSGYTWIDSDEPGGPSFNWIDISSTGTALDSTSAWDSTGTYPAFDEGYLPISLPFPFSYYGNVYQTAYIITNGVVSFAPPSSDTYANQPIPTPGGPLNGFLAGFWFDLQIAGSAKIYYGMSGSNFVVQWVNISMFGPIGVPNYTFEYIFKPNGQIVYQYLAMGTNGGDINSCTVGIQNATGTTGLNVVYNASYVHDNLAVLFSPPGVGGSNDWLSIAPVSGTIVINDSSQFTATFDATSTGFLNNPGDYYGRVELTAVNSTPADSLEIPAHMFVNPRAGAHLSVNTDTLNYGNVEIGHTASRSVLVRNTGASTLNVTNISISNGTFVATPTSFSLPSLDTQRVQIVFSAPSPGGQQEGIMNFVTNDSTPPVVYLSALSLPIAHIEVSPDSISITQQEGPDTLTNAITIHNPGTDTLHYKIAETRTKSLTPLAAARQSEQFQPLPKGVEDNRRGPAQTLSAGGPDQFGYRWIDSDDPNGPTFNWTDITTIGSQVSWTSGDGDEGHAILSMPLNFTFYGTNYSSVKITTNGFISFDVVSTNHTFSNTVIPNPLEPNTGVYCFWDDLDMRVRGSVYTYYDVPNNRFIIEYFNAPHFNGGGPYTFEVILTSTGDIYYEYLSMSTPLTSASIGIENATGTDGLQVVYDNTYIHNNLAIRFTNDLYPWMSTNITSGTIVPKGSELIQLRTHPGYATPLTYSGMISVTGNSPDTANISVHLTVTPLPDTIEGMVYEDLDGDSLWENREPGIAGWKVFLSGPSTDTTTTDSLGKYRFLNITAGTYLIREVADSGWTRTQPRNGNYKLTVGTGQHRTGYNFGNFLHGSITCIVWNDLDSNGVRDAGEPGIANWVVHASGEKPGNSFQQTTDHAGIVVFGNLDADTYTLQEDLKTGYIETYPASGTHVVTLSSSDHLSGENFGNISIDTTLFRTFSADSITFAHDGSGRIGRAIAKKANPVVFRIFIRAATSSHTLTLNFNMDVNATVYRGATGLDSIVAINGRILGPVNLPVSSGDSIRIEGVGSTGKPMRATYQWGTMLKSSIPGSWFALNSVTLPMPNVINLLSDLYNQNIFGSKGLTVGVPLSKDNASTHGWAQIKKLDDALKSFYDAGLWHNGDPKAFDLLGSKPFTGRQPVVSPYKFNSRLFAELAALKINMASSAARKTPAGFGNLLFNDGSGSRFCGKSVMSIAASSDSFMTFGEFLPDSIALNYYITLHKLNLSFSGPMDTVSFGQRLVIKGAKRVRQVPYMFHDTGSDHATGVGSSMPTIPTAFSLEQNYPNPFNPNTTIRFALPEEGTVTLKVYDILGREVALLVNREQMNAGEYNVEFNANNLASGVYFYRISVEMQNNANPNTFTGVKKLLLIK